MAISLGVYPIFRQTQMFLHITSFYMCTIVHYSIGIYKYPSSLVSDAFSVVGAMIGDFPQQQKQPKPMPPPSHIPIFPGQLSTTQRHVPRKLWSFWLTLGAPLMEQAKSEGGTKGGTSGSQKEEKTRLGCEYLLLIPWHTVGFLKVSIVISI